MTVAGRDQVLSVEVYWRPGCPYCSSLRRALARRGVAASWRNIWDDEEARELVRTANDGAETVPTVRVGSRMLSNPRAVDVARFAGVVAPGRTPSAGQRRALRALSWLPTVVLVIASVVLDAAGHTGLSWAVDPFALAAWWLTRPLRR